MTRRAAAALAGVVALLAGSLFLGLRHEPGRPVQRGGSSQELARLRLAAGLEPCPSSLSPALPRLRLDCLAGGPPVSVAARPPGRPTLVNVWATWCPPCRTEVPILVAFAARARGAVDLVGILTEDEETLGLEFAREAGIHYPSLVDPDGTVMRAFPPGPPTTLFLDASGRVVFRHGGQLHSVAELVELVRAHLGVAV